MPATVAADAPTREVGRTGIAVSRLSLGTGFLGGLGEAVDAGRFAATIDAAFACGVTYFDTAPIYGLGVSEERLGDALGGRVRNSFVLSTKIGRLLRPNDATFPGAELDLGYDTAWHGVAPRKIVVDFSYDATLRSIEESLARLKQDRLDITYIHDTFEPHHFAAAMNGAYPALQRLRDQGAVRAIGVGIGKRAILNRFMREGDFDCLLVAGRYTLLDHDGAAELLQACRAKSTSIILGGVFNSGILADPWGDRVRFDYQPATAALVDKARRLAEVCTSHGVPLKAAALQFPLAETTVASVLMGAARAGEVEENIRLFQMTIPAALWRDLRAEGLVSADVATPA